MTGQNRSAAVMQQRVATPDGLDDFPTPPWATRAFCEALQKQCGLVLRDKTCLEPACNRGYMAMPLHEYFASVDASDIHPYGFGRVADFLPTPLFPQIPDRVDWVVTNPPFNKAVEFLRQALAIARVGVALLVRVAWKEGQERYEQVFSRPMMRPTYWLQYAERVLMLEGRLVRDGAIDPKTGERVSTATCYGWAVWVKGDHPAWMRSGWIPPSRYRLERLDDYPEYPPGYFTGVAA